MTPYAEKLLAKKEQKEKHLREFGSMTKRLSSLPASEVKAREYKKRLPFRARCIVPKLELPRMRKSTVVNDKSAEFYALLEKYPPGSEEAFIVLRRFSRVIE